MQKKVILKFCLGIWVIVPLAIILSLSFVSNRIPSPEKAKIWMMASALMGWGIFSMSSLMLYRGFGLDAKPAPDNVFARFFGFTFLATIFAMIEEVFTQFMTDNAIIYGAPIGKAYITPGLDYWDTVMHHSVVVFIPMFLIVAFCSERWQFNPKEICFLVGLTGLFAEMTQNPFSLFMGFWILVYGFMVLLPAQIFYQGTSERKVRKWWHYPLTIVFALIAAVVASLAIHGMFPDHPDNHFSWISSVEQRSSLLLTKSL